MNQCIIVFGVGISNGLWQCMYDMSMFKAQFIKKQNQMQKISINDFTGLTEIGHGAFGKVFKAFFKNNKRTFALKRMQISHLQKQNMISQINTQITISTNLKHDNIIRVYDCFQDDQYIYLVLELAQNGQLYEKLRKVGRFDENTVKKMIKDVIAAVQYLHSRNPPIVHRDIKPENLLLDKNDKIKLADFGWSTVLNKPRKTYCGTVDYLAPEMIDKSGHDDKLDIWCIGVLVYELLTGRTPFLGPSQVKNPQAVYDNILNVRIQFPEYFPTLAKDFVLGMIKRNPKQRMTFPQIKNHPWLQQKTQNQIKFLKPESVPTIPNEKVQNNNNEPDNQKIIKELKKNVRQLQQKNLMYKTKIQQLQGKSNQNGKNIASEINQVNRLMNEVRRLKVAEEMNQKYKQKEEKMWDEINQKEKQIIRMKTDLKRVEDMKAQIQRLEGDKQKLQDKLKKTQKQLQNMEQKNKQLQVKVDQMNSGFSQRVKNGQRIRKQQIQSPEFMTFLRDQIAQLNDKFEESKDVVSAMLRKQQSDKKMLQDYNRLKAEERKLRQILRAQLKEQFQNEKDELLMKVRNELTDEKEKWFKERQELKALYEQGAQGSNSNNNSGKNTREQDLQGQLKNVRELNSYYQKTLNKQKHQIQDLKQELRRKK